MLVSCARLFVHETICMYVQGIIIIIIINIISKAHQGQHANTNLANTLFYIIISVLS